MLRQCDSKLMNSAEPLAADDAVKDLQTALIVVVICPVSKSESYIYIFKEELHFQVPMGFYITYISRK